MNRIYNAIGREIHTPGPSFTKGIAHRGYTYATTINSINNEDGAPENTLPAYQLAAQKGFRYAETDVSFTSDGVAVCLHDNTIDRTSNGTGDISGMTLAQARQYSYNYMGETQIAGYDGVQIPTLKELLTLCRNIGLHLYIELKNNAQYTESQINGVVDLVNSVGMKGKVTYISFNVVYLGYVKDHDAESRLGLLVYDAASDYSISVVKAYLSSGHDAFLDMRAYTTEVVAACEAESVPLETWGLTNNPDKDAIINLNPYISGVTHDNYDAGQVLYDADIIYTPGA